MQNVQPTTNFAKRIISAYQNSKKHLVVSEMQGSGTGKQNNALEL